MSSRKYPLTDDIINEFKDCIRWQAEKFKSNTIEIGSVLSRGGRFRVEHQYYPVKEAFEFFQNQGAGKITDDWSNMQKGLPTHFEITDTKYFEINKNSKSKIKKESFIHKAIYHPKQLTSFELLGALGSIASIIGLAVALFAYFVPPNELQSSIETDVSATTSLKSIDIPVSIFNSLGTEAWIEPEAEFYILKPETPSNDMNVLAGAVRLSRPKDITTLNGNYPVPPNMTIHTSITLPNSNKIKNYLFEGGYKLKLIIRNSWSNEYGGYGKIILDKKGILSGIKVSIGEHYTPNK